MKKKADLPAMKILAVDSSATPASCAVIGDGRVLASSYIHTGLTHSQTLAPMIEDMLKNAALEISDIDLMAVAHGPGSFTGVRIGVAAVKGMAFVRNTPCAGISTLAATARGLTGTIFGKICVAMDARREQVYTAIFSCGDGGMLRITEDAALSTAEVVKRVLDADEDIWLAGDGAELCYKACIDSGALNARLLPSQLRYQNAVGVAMEAEASGIRITAEELRPVYLRLPQAERELSLRVNGKMKG